MDSKIKEMLEKQLQLLSERSEEAILEELPNLTRAMIETATLLSGVRSQESPLDAVSSAVKACTERLLASGIRCFRLSRYGESCIGWPSRMRPWCSQRPSRSPRS